MIDLRVWCLERCYVSNDTTLHKPFISKFYVNSCSAISVFITARQLIPIEQLSDLLQRDPIFQLNWNDSSVLAFGCSDARQRFYSFGIPLIGTDEAASSYIGLCKTIKQTVLDINGKIF